jgi:hypothetical protein
MCGPPPLSFVRRTDARPKVKVRRLSSGSRRPKSLRRQLRLAALMQIFLELSRFWLVHRELTSS